MENDEVKILLDEVIKCSLKSTSLTFEILSVTGQIKAYLDVQEKEIERLRQVVRNQNQQISKLKEKEAKRR